MTDEELDRDWKPNGRRPQSTIARSFSQELGDIFRIDNSVADLDEQIDKRKQLITTQATELEALEARIREMEQRLRSSKPDAGNNLDQRLASAVSGGSPRSQRPPVSNAFDQPQAPETGAEAPPPLPQKDHARRGAHDQRQQQQQQHSRSRAGTARQAHQAMPGALPPTPVASEGEYELVIRNRSTLPTTISSSSITGPTCTSNLQSSSPFSPAPSLDEPGRHPKGDTPETANFADVADFVIVAAQDGDDEQDA